MNVLVVDERVRDYQVFLDSVNESTQAIVFRTRDDLIHSLEVPCERIGFVFEQGTPMAQVLLESKEQLIASGIKEMDFLACDTLSDPVWVEFYANLTGIRVGASNNRTGNIQYGGDWLMESTCEDIEKVYFTKSIEYYMYVLGGSHTMIIINRAVYTCGDYLNGKLGRSYDTASGTNRNDRFLSVTNLTNIVAISAGTTHSIALDSNGAVYTCGDSTYGQLGRTYDTTSGVDRKDRFLSVTNLTNIVAISAGGYHSIALDSTGRVYTCGFYYSGQLGRSYDTTSGVNRNDRFLSVTNLTNIVAISAGEYHSIALDSNGAVYTCGEYSSGRLGRSYETTSSTANSYDIFVKVNISNVDSIQDSYPSVRFLSNDILTVSPPYKFTANSITYQRPDYFGYISDFSLLTTGDSLNNTIGPLMHTVDRIDGTYVTSSMCIFGYFVPSQVTNSFQIIQVDDIAAFYIGTKDQSIENFRSTISSQTVTETSRTVLSNGIIYTPGGSEAYTFTTDLVIGGYYPIVLNYINILTGATLTFKANNSFDLSNVVKSSKAHDAKNNLMFYALTHSKSLEAGLVQYVPTLGHYLDFAFSSSKIKKVCDPKWAIYYDSQKMSVQYTSTNRTLFNGPILDIQLHTAKRVGDVITIIGKGLTPLLTIKFGSDTITGITVSGNMLSFNSLGTGTTVYAMYGYTTSNKITVGSELIQSIIQKDNLLTVIGTNVFRPSFSLDGIAYPIIMSSLTGYVGTINFDNFNLKNVDMVQSFVNAYDSTTPGSGTVTFVGVFRPTSNGKWIFQLSADDSATVTIVDQGGTSILNQTIAYNTVWSGQDITVTGFESKSYTITIVWLQTGTGFEGYKYNNGNRIVCTFIDPFFNLIQDLSPYVSYSGQRGFMYTTTETITRDVLTPYTTKSKFFYYGNSTSLGGINFTRFDYAIKTGGTYTLYGNGLTGITASISNSQIQTLLTEQTNSNLTLTYESDTISTFTGLSSIPTYVGNNRIVITKNGYSVDALLYDSPTATSSSLFATLRNFPVDKFPQVINGLYTNVNPSAYVYYGYFYAPADGVYTFGLPAIDDVGNFIIGRSQDTYSTIFSQPYSDYLLTLAAYWNGGTGVYSGYTANGVSTTNYGVTLTAGTYYPVVLSYINATGGTYIRCTVKYGEVTKDLLSYCYTEKSYAGVFPQEGLYFYQYNQTQLDSFMGSRTITDIPSVVTYNSTANANMYKLFTRPADVSIGFLPRSSTYRIPSTYGTTSTLLLVPTISTRVAHCYYGYFKSSVSGDHTFSFTGIDDVANFRIGQPTQTILELRNNNTPFKQFSGVWNSQINNTMIASLTANTLYPVLLTFVNSGGVGNIGFTVSATGLESSDTLSNYVDLNGIAGLNYYTLDQKLLESISLGSVSNSELLLQISRIFSPQWVFVEADQSITVMVANPYSIPLSGAILLVNELKIINCTYSGTTLTIEGSGFHSNVKVYLSGSATSTPATLSGDKLVILNTTSPTTVLITDGYVRSNTYQNSYINNVPPVRALTSLGETFTYSGSGLPTPVFTGVGVGPTVSSGPTSAVLTIPYNTIKTTTTFSVTFGSLPYSYSSYTYIPFTANKSSTTDLITIRQGIATLPTSSQVATAFFPPSTNANVYFGYFLAEQGTYRFTLNGDAVDFRMGSNSLSDLRSTGDLDIVLLRSTYGTFSKKFEALERGYYPLVITQRSSTIQLACTVEFSPASNEIYQPSTSIFTYVFSEPNGTIPRLFSYTLNQSIHSSFTTYSQVYSSVWPYQTIQYWGRSSTFLMSSIFVNLTIFTITSVTYNNGNVIVAGTGLHNSVTLYINNSYVESTYSNGVISAPAGTIQKLVLMDGLLESNVYIPIVVNAGYTITNDVITFTGTNLLDTQVTYTPQGGTTGPLPSGWVVETFQDKITLTPPFGSVRGDIYFTPVFNKLGILSYTTLVTYSSSTYIRLDQPSLLTTYLGDTFTFGGVNLTSTRSEVNGYSIAPFSTKIVATAPLGSTRNEITINPTFKMNGIDLGYTLNFRYKSSTFIDTSIPTVVWNSTGDTLTFTGTNLLNTQVTSINGWSYTAESTKITVSIPQGSVRRSINIFPNFSNVGLLDYGKSVPVKSTVYVDLAIPTKIVESTGEVFTFNGENLTNTIVSNVSTWTPVVANSKITVRVPLGSVRGNYSLTPIFRNGGDLDYPFSVNYESDAYVNKVIPTPVVTSTGEQLIFSGKNLSTTGVLTTTSLSYPYVVNATEIIATIPLGSVRSQINIEPTFTKVGLLDYGLTIPFTSNSYVNLGFTQDLSPAGLLVKYTGVNLAGSTANFSGTGNTLLNWTTVATDTQIVATLPFYTPTTKFTPSFNKVGKLSYGQEDTFTPTITSVTRRDNLLVVQGNGFGTNTSFLLDGILEVPPTISNKYTTINYQAYNLTDARAALSNYDMVKIFNTTTDYYFVYRIRFSGTFTPDLDGEWTFKINADNNAVLNLTNKINNLTATGPPLPVPASVRVTLVAGTSYTLTFEWDGYGVTTNQGESDQRLRVIPPNGIETFNFSKYGFFQLTNVTSLDVISTIPTNVIKLFYYGNSSTLSYFPITRLSYATYDGTHRIRGTGFHSNMVIKSGTTIQTTVPPTNQTNVPSTILPGLLTVAGDLRDTFTAYNGIYPTDTITVTRITHATLKNEILTVRGVALDNTSLYSTLDLGFTTRNTSTLTIRFEGNSVSANQFGDFTTTLGVARIDQAYRYNTSLYVVGPNLATYTLKSSVDLTSVMVYGAKEWKEVGSFNGTTVTATKIDSTDTVQVTNMSQAYFGKIEGQSYLTLYGTNFSAYMPFRNGTTDYQLVRKGPAYTSIKISVTTFSDTFPDIYLPPYPNARGFLYKAGSIYGTFTPTKAGAWTFSVQANRATLWLEQKIMSVGETTAVVQLAVKSYPFQFNWINTQGPCTMNVSVCNPDGVWSDGVGLFSLSSYTRGSNALDPDSKSGVQWISNYTDHKIQILSNVSSLILDTFLPVNVSVPSVPSLAAIQKTYLTIPIVDMNLSFVTFKGGTFQYLNGSVQVPVGSDTETITLGDPNGYTTTTQFTYLSPSLSSIVPPIQKAGLPVVIYGSLLANTSDVLFGNASSNFSFNTSSLWVKVPSGDSESVTVVDRSGLTSTISFTYIATKLLNITPAQGLKTNSFVVTGNYLENVSTLYFRGANSTGNLSIKLPFTKTIENQKTVLNASVPDLDGNVDVIAYDTQEDPVLSSLTFLYLTPSIQSLVPNAGPDGCRVYVNGYNLRDALFVFNEAVIPWYYDEGRPYVIVPSGTGIKSVKLTNSLGQIYDTQKTFTYQNPSVTGGNLYGTRGTRATLTGANLSRTTGVYFKDQFVPVETRGVQVTVLAPSSSVNVSLTVVDDCGNNASGYNFIYQNPSITNMVPPAGPPTISATLIGLNISNTSRVLFQGNPTPFEFISPNLSVYIPPYSGVNSPPIWVYDNLDNVASTSYTYETPTLQTIGSGTTKKNVTLTGIYLSNISKVNFGSLNASFTVLSSQSILAEVPPSEGIVSVTAKERYNYTTAPIPFQYTNVSIAELVPNQGPKGRPILFRGSNLTAENLNQVKVRFNGELANTNLDQGLTVTAPPGEGVASITLTDFYGNVYATPPFTYQNMSLQAVTPLQGTKNQRIDLSGIYLSNLSEVRWDKAPAQVEPSSTGLVAIVPAGTGNVSIFIENKFGTILEHPVQFQYQNQSPSVFTPLSGPQRSLLQCEGSYLNKVTTVWFGGVSIPFQPVDASKFNLSVPDGAVNASIEIQDEYGNRSLYEQLFTYTNPTLTGSDTLKGSKGRSVVLTGRHFSNITNVEFGGISTTFHLVSTTQINASIPASDSEVAITVTAKYQNTTSLAGFVYQNPVVDSIFPLEGRQRSSTYLYGKFLSNLTQVTIGGNVVPILQNTDSVVEVKIPDSTGIVSVLAMDGIYTYTPLMNQFTYRNPTIREVNPSVGQQKREVTLLGENLTQIKNVSVGDKSTTFRYVAGGLSIYIPVGSGNASIQVTDDYQTTVNASFTYQNPTFTSFEPTSAPQRSEITLRGSYLYNISHVKFGEQVTMPSYIDAGLLVKVPVGTGTVPIEISDIYQNVMTLSNFSYTNPSVYPVSSAVQKSSLDIYGVNLSKISTVYFSNVSASFTYISGGINLSVPDFDGTVDLTLTDVYGNNTSTRFTYLNPALTESTAYFGSYRKRIFLSGRNLQDTVSVNFSGTNASFSYQTNLSVTVPLFEGNASVYSTDKYGNRAYLPSPFLSTETTVTSISERFGTYNKVLKLSGNYLQNVSAVTIGVPTTFQYIAPDLNVSVPIGTGTVPIQVFDLENDEIYTSTFEYRNMSLYLDSLVGKSNLSVQITGVNLALTSSVVFGATPATFIPGETIEAKVPVGSNNASIVVTDIYGNSKSLNFFYQNPFIQSANVSSGAKNTSIRFIGSYLGDTVRAYVGSQNASFDTTRLEITVPVGQEVGALPVYLDDSVGNRVFSPSLFTYTDPALTRLDPPSGAFNQIVHVYGNNLSNTQIVRLNGTSLPFDRIDNTRINVSIPNFTGSTNLEVIDNVSNNVSLPFLFDHPLFNDFIPKNGPRGIPMTLQGDALLNTSHIYVEDIEILSYTRSRTELVFSMPDTSGNTTFRIVDAFGNERTKSSFLYQNPRIDTMLPDQGPVNRILTLSGINLSNTTVIVNQKRVPNISTGGAQVTFQMPLFADILDSQVLSVVARDPYGNQQSFPFTYQKTTLTTIEPYYGTFGSTSYITGTYLQYTRRIRFGGVDASFTVLSPTNLSIRTPSSSGKTPVTVEDDAGNFLSTTDFYYRNPTINNISPDNGTQQTEVLFEGDHLSLTSRVLFGGRPAEIRSTFPLTVNAPAGVGNASVEVIDIYGNSVYTSFDYYNTTFIPFVSRGPSRSPLYIEGTYLTNITRIFFGDFISPFYTGTNTSHRVTVPDGSGNVSVYAYDRLNNRIEMGSFTYENPRFISLDPPYGPEGTRITIQGDYLANTSFIFMGNTSRNFSNNVSLSFFSTGEDGSIRVYDRYTNQIDAFFEVRNAKVTTLFPVYGVTGSTIRLTGINFSNTSTVLFGREPGPILTKTDNVLIVQVPYSSGNVSVYVKDTLHNEVFAGKFEHRSGEITSINVSYGPYNTFVDMVGVNLSNVSTVFFGRVPARIVEWNDTFIQVRAPNTSGTVLIEAMDIYKNIWEAGTFEYRTPVLKSIFPLAGPKQQEMIFSGDFLSMTQNVIFGDTNVSFRVVDGEVRAIIPPLQGNVSVRLLDEVDNLNESPFTYLNPAFTSLSLLSETKNASIVISGVNLSNTSYVRFGNVSALLGKITGDEVEVRVPDSIGFVNIEVEDAFQNLIYTSKFRFERPVIQSMSPTAGVSPMGLTLYGEELIKTRAVYFDNEPATLVQVLASTVYVKIPKGTGTVTVRMVDIYGNVFVSPKSFTFFNEPTPVPVQRQKFSNQTSTKMLQSKMIQGKQKIGYQNTRSRSFETVILSRDYLENRSLLLRFGYKGYTRIVEGIVGGNQSNQIKSEIIEMVRLLLLSLTEPEYNLVYGIVVKEEVTPEPMVDSNITFEVVARTLGPRSYFIFKNLPDTFLFLPLTSYTFDLSHPSNLGTRLCFSDIPGVPYEGISYVETPGNPGAKLILSIYSTSPDSALYVYNSPDLASNSYSLYEWGYSVPSIRIHRSTEVLETLYSPVYEYVRQHSNIAIYEHMGPKFSINSAISPEVYYGFRPFRYSFTYGTYFLYIPRAYPTTLLNKGFESSISFVGESDKTFTSLVLGTSLFGQNMDGVYSFYYGKVQLNVYRPFSTDLSFYSADYGFMGGDSMVHFVEPYVPPSLPLFSLYNKIEVEEDILFNGSKTLGFTMGVYSITTTRPITFLNRGREHLFYVRDPSGNLVQYGPYMSSDHTPYLYYTGTMEIVVCGYIEYIMVEAYQGPTYMLMYESFYGAPESFVLSSYVLSVHNRVHILDNTYLTFNNVFDYSETKFQVGIGVYHFLNISPDYPMTFLNEGIESIVELESLTPNGVIPGIGPDGVPVNFYVGVLRMTIRGNFKLLSAYTLTNGYMGGFECIEYGNYTNEASYPDNRSVPKIERLPDQQRQTVVVVPQPKISVDCSSRVYAADPNLSYIEVYNIRQNTLNSLIRITYENRFVFQAYQEPFLENPIGEVEYVFGRGIYALYSTEYITLLNKGKEKKIKMFSVLQSVKVASDGNEYAYCKGDAILLYVMGNFGRISIESLNGNKGINLLRHIDTRA